MAKIVQTSEKHEACFDVFCSECRLSSRFTSKIVQTSEKHEACFDVFYSECRLSSV